MYTNNYKAPDQNRIAHIHLKGSDPEQSLEFYRDLLGFEVTTLYGDQAAFLSAGGYQHDIGLNTWQSRGVSPAPRQSAGLFHTAFLYPTRKGLASIAKRLMDNGYPIFGTRDHGVSETIYLDDPDGNGVELYRDRPKKRNGYTLMMAPFTW